MEPKIQKRKVGVAGSFINQMMGNNASLPVVGEGATILHYSDRDCAEVIEVSADGKTARLESLSARWDETKSGGMGHQNWILEPTGHFFTVTWRNNAWRTIGKEVTFTPEFLKKCESDDGSYPALWLRNNAPEISKQIYDGNPWPQNVVEGYTKQRTVYHKISIIFGRKDYHYDWSF